MLYLKLKYQSPKIKEFQKLAHLFLKLKFQMHRQFQKLQVLQPHQLLQSSKKKVNLKYDLHVQKQSLQKLELQKYDLLYLKLKFKRLRFYQKLRLHQKLQS